MVVLKKCHFVNLPFMTIDEVLLYEQPNVMPFMGMDIGDGFNFIDLGLGKMIRIYIYVYLIIAHDEDMHRQGTASNQKTEPMPAGELEGSIPVFFCSSAVLHGLETGFERQNQCCL